MSGWCRMYAVPAPMNEWDGRIVSSQVLKQLVELYADEVVLLAEFSHDFGHLLASLVV